MKACFQSPIFVSMAQHLQKKSTVLLSALLMSRTFTLQILQLFLTNRYGNRQSLTTVVDSRVYVLLISFFLSPFQFIINHGRFKKPYCSKNFRPIFSVVEKKIILEQQLTYLVSAWSGNQIRSPLCPTPSSPFRSQCKCTCQPPLL